jgi:hypothetical protein
MTLLGQAPACWNCSASMVRPDGGNGHGWRDGYWWCYTCEVGCPYEEPRDESENLSDFWRTLLTRVSEDEGENS